MRRRTTDQTLSLENSSDAAFKDLDLQERADDLFLEAAAMESEADRLQLLNESCADQPALRQEIDQLFAMQDDPERLGYISSPARISALQITNIPDFFEQANKTFQDDHDIGKQIGNYKLLQKIGEGGVGKVYLAEQSKPVRRQVALKIIKAGMDTKSVIARFEAERQALAMMEHPSIARVLNAGETETGRPYFVMELVHGERITTYCDEHNLKIPQRLKLLVQICHAIQHAHQKGIIHRDIKPTNVLITQHNGVPCPVVIDFGIAKTTFAYLSLIALTLLVVFGTSTVLFFREREAKQQQARLLREAEDRERIAHAAFLINQNRIEEAEQTVDAVTTELSPSLEAESVLRTLGEWHTLQGRWEKAAERFNQLLVVDVKDNSWAITGDLLRAGPLLIERGDINGYNQFRKAAITRYSGTTDPIFAERTLKISLLLPADDEMMQQLQPFADIAREASLGQITDIMTAWRCVFLALAAYRQDHFSSAINWCERTRSYRNDASARTATAHIIQAMAHHQQNETERAVQALQIGRDMILPRLNTVELELGDGNTGFVYDWLFARILLREAEAIIER